MSPAIPVGDPVFLPLDGGEPLPGPETRALARGPGAGVEAVTGGGLAALVDPTRGLRSLWQGSVQVAGVLRLRRNDRLLHPAPDIRMDDAGWERRVPLAGGGTLVERALLLDSAPALVLHWTPLEEGTGGAPLVIELQPPGGRPTLSLTVEPGREEGGWALLLPPGSDPDALLPRIRPVAARARARRARGGEGANVFLATLQATGASGSTNLLAAALELLDRGPLGASSEGRPVGPFLVGVEEGAPRFAVGAALAELGLGALMAGRGELAWAALADLLAASEPVPGSAPAILHLAGALAAWTGRPDRLVAFRSELDAVLDRVTSPNPSLTPGPGTPARDRPRKGLPLPVLGASVPSPGDPAAGTRGDAERDASLPPPEALGALDDPGLAPRRGLQAARLVRSWVEGALGARPDASYGRLRLAPDLIGHAEGLTLRRLRVGDAHFDVECRLDGSAWRLQLVQHGGRLPFNVVFEPRLPLRPPVTVHLGGSEAQVGVEPVEGGVALSCQFPLDPERRLVVDGRS